MIYVDTSAALAYLLSEDRRPPDEFWIRETLVSSRLLEYEVYNRLNAYKLPDTAREVAQNLINRIGLVELIPEIVSRAREPFPTGVRTLDALHLSTALFLDQQGIGVTLASYDEQMRTAAARLKLPLSEYTD